MKVALIERKLIGGTCVNTGCTPTKTLVASAQAAYIARRASDYGVSVGPRRRRHEGGQGARRGRRRRLAQWPDDWLRGLERCTVVEGHARLESARQVRVGDELLEAERIFINTGGRAFVPDMPGIDRVRFLTNTTMVALDHLPRHLVVVGGSYVGLEFAQMYRRFGSEVTVVEKGPRLIQHEDEDVSAAVADIMDRGGRGPAPGGRVHPLRAERRRCRGRRAMRGRRATGHRLARPAGGGAAAQHRRSRPGPRRRRDRRARLHPRGRAAAHQRARHLGDGRLQRQGRLHPHGLQRLRDHRGQPARRRPRARSAIASPPTRCTWIRRSAGSG